MGRGGLEGKGRREHRRLKHLRCALLPFPAPTGYPNPGMEGWMDRGKDGGGPGGLTFADPHFVLGDGVPVERRADDTAQAAVARPVQPIDSPAALVPLPGAHEAAAADAQHDAAGAALGLLAFGLVAGQADESPRPRLAQQQQQGQQEQPPRQVPAAVSARASPPRRDRCQVHPRRRSPAWAGGASGSPLAGLLPAAPASGPPRKVSSLSAAAASAKLLLRVAAPPAAPSGRRRPSVRWSAVPGWRRGVCGERRRLAVPVPRASRAPTRLLPHSRPAPSAPSALPPLADGRLRPAPSARPRRSHWAAPGRARPLPSRAPPVPILSWKRRSGGEERPGPHGGRASASSCTSPPPPGLRARSGAGRRRQTAGTGHRGRGEREGPAKGAAPAGRC